MASWSLFVSPAGAGAELGIWTFRARVCVISRIFSGCLRLYLRPGAGNKRASVKFDNKVLQRSCHDWGGGWGRKADGVGES